MRRGLFVLVSLVASSLLSFAQAPAPAQFGGDEASSAWTAVVSDEIQREEYSFHALTAEPAVVSAPNRSQELRSRVSSTGIEVFPRATSADGVGAEWKLTLRTTSFGRVSADHGALAVHELGDARITTSANRVELDHGLLTEWFVNDERGIEQGWTIAERQRGVEPLWIGLDFGADLSLRIEEGGRSGVLVDACAETKLRYRDLVVFDATGRELDARLSPSSSGLGIEIDDTSAVYPVTVDPLLTGPAWTAESDQTHAAFGYSVATAGDVNGDGYSDVIVGAYRYDSGQTDEGRASVYLGSAAGLAPLPAWTAESNQANAEFGVSVSTAGDVNGDGYSEVIIGSAGYDGAATDSGRVFVYVGSAAGLSTTAAWTAEGDQATASFGWSVAGAGDVNADGFSDVIVGAPSYDNGQVSEGRVYVYRGSAGGLALAPAWTAESNQGGAAFGFSVSTAGDVDGDGFGDVIVGAHHYDNGQFFEGRAFVYLGSASGLSASSSWTAESDQADAEFGASVSTAGDVNGDGFSDVIVGAPSYDDPNPPFTINDGRVFLYMGSASGLSAAPSWTASRVFSPATNYGAAVATAGDVNGDGFSDVMIGALSESNAEGRAFVYLGSASGPLPSFAGSGDWEGGSGQAGALYGNALGTAGDVNGDGFSDVIVGAMGYENGQTDEGRAFVYMGSNTGLSASSAWTVGGGQVDAQLGGSIATAGDVNADGFSDVVVGALLYDNGQVNEGRAFVYLGSSAGLAGSPAWTAEGNAIGVGFGSTVATAGDVNGDGFSDVIVGATGFIDERAFLFLGSSSGLSSSAAWTAQGGSVAAAGDVNGDGYGDVIIGSPSYDGAVTDCGRVFVYLGSATGLATTAAWTAEGDQATAILGTSVATAGDVNADGFSDVIVGASLYDNGQPDEGRAYVYLGAASGLATVPAWTAEGNQFSANYGHSVASAGDVNGDGFSDVIVGAYIYDNGQSNEGRAFVYVGSSSGLSTSAAWTAEADQSSAFFGACVASAGDVNADGFGDVLVGAPNYDNPQVNEGRAYLYFGSASGLSASAAWMTEGNQAEANFGGAVATAGDVNGDGFADVIVGAPLYDGGAANEGRVSLFLGNEGRGGWTLAPQQRRASDAAPIALLGRSNDEHDFRVQLRFERELAGFSWASGVTPTARLEWEVAPLRAALDGSRIEQGVAQTITGSPLTFNQLVAFVSTADSVLPFGIGHHVAAGSYHWRARVRTNNPLFPVTPWTTMAWNNVTETKLRVLGPLPATRIAR